MTAFTTRDGHVDLSIGAYVLDALDDVERAAVERHLRECAVCAVEAAELAETAARLGATETATPPAGLRELVLDAARSTPQRHSATATSRRRGPGLRRLAVAAAAIVLVAASAGATWWSQQGRIEREHARTVAAEQHNSQVRAILTAPDARIQVAPGVGTGRITAIYSPGRRAAVVSYDGLEAPGAGMTYQFWHVAAGVPTSLGALPTGRSTGSLLVDRLDATDGIAVSVEPAGGSPSPTLPAYAALTLK